ncbi:uncharacterized protein STEHIDRAFT_64559 [Stereum hirsutum FP-91666 SS1]|uniref:uncharacterized protein n=1 Tax=Stereum hirsutum (strain FP-91666) TaxID=721885 RepID=UPI0004449DED|nr:uncharacterized protein STEHIDRAFT_64559 [Stereum hirsutum FP-91666 SS1]EIM82625.1 hypothetical protein STEHIDRAFT_64559 [Stereum hirsutum FP-91666 SS1]
MDTFSQAVLLLRPHVPLYSTDALPVNCSAYSTSRVALLPSRPPSDPPRTCECLTQTLCCHGCGNGVGYMIVIPVSISPYGFLQILHSPPPTYQTLI